MSVYSRPPRPQPQPGRRGRPPGSVSLTAEMQKQIVAYIRGGAFPVAAALATGVAERTFYEWLARGKGEHPSRGPSRKLKAFAREIERAWAEARVAAEVQVYRKDPKFWLTHAARSRPGREGWTKPPETERQEPPPLTPWALRRLTNEELEQEIARLQEPTGDGEP